MLNKLSLKNRFLLLIFLISTAFTVIFLPYFWKTYQTYKYYDKEYKGLVCSENILSLITALLSQDKENITKFARILDDLCLYYGKLFKIRDQWEVAEEYIKEFLDSNRKNKNKLFSCISELLKIEGAVFQYSGAIADPDKAAINLLIAHYSAFPPLLFYYIENGFLSPFILSKYLKYLNYALTFNPDLKSLFSDIHKLNSYDVTLNDLLSIEKKSLNWIKTYTLYRKRKVIIKLCLSCVIVFLTITSILLITRSLLNTVNTNLLHLKNIAQAIKQGNYAPIYQTQFSTQECHEECLIIMQEIINSLKFQEKNLKTLQTAIKKLAEGEFISLNSQELSGIFSELYSAEAELAFQLKILKRKLLELTKGLKKGKLTFLEPEELKGKWKLWIYHYNNGIKNLQDFLNILQEKLEYLKEGKIKEVLLPLPEEHETWGNYISSIRKSVQPFYFLLESLKQLLAEVEKGNFQDIEKSLPQENFKNEFKELKDIVIKLLKIYSKKIQMLECKLKQEEELNFFKSAVEMDKDINTIWQRIENLLKRKFGVKIFACKEFEAKEGKVILRLAFPEGKFFCNNKLLENPELCRAKRLGKIVKGDEEKWGKICPMYNGPYPRYFCIPFFFKGEVKCVLQIICPSKENFKSVEKNLEDIVKYLEKIVPIVHTREVLPS